jgi:hypothetical protein
MDVVSGQIVPRTEQKHIWVYGSGADAVAALEATIEQKVAKGYVPTSGSMRPALSVFDEKTKRLQSKQNVSVATIAAQIRHLEEFDVVFVRRSKRIRRKVRSDLQGLPNYNGRFQRRLSGTKSVADLKRIRFACYPKNIDIDVLDADGNIMLRHTRLSTIRRTYLRKSA